MSLESDRWFYVNEEYRFRIHEEDGLPDIAPLPPEFQEPHLVDYERKVGDKWEESGCDYATDAEITMWQELLGLREETHPSRAALAGIAEVLVVGDDEYYHAIDDQEDSSNVTTNCGKIIDMPACCECFFASVAYIENSEPEYKPCPRCFPPKVKPEKGE